VQPELRLALAALALASALVPTASAQTPIWLIGEGDELAGIGTVTAVESVHVDYFGWWTVQVATDNPAIPSVALRQGAVHKKVGDPVPSVPGATLAGFGRWSEDLFGGISFLARLDGTPGGATDNQVVLNSYSSGLHLQTGTPTSPATQYFPPGTVWASFGEVHFGQFWSDYAVTGTVVEPAVPGSERTFLARAMQYGSIGICCIVDVLAEEGQAAPGLSARIERIRTGSWNARMQDRGEELYWSCDLAAPAAMDGCVYRCVLLGQTHTLIAREGSPSPVAGRSWGPLEDLALDARGPHWTMRTFLDASDPSSDGILVRDGAKLVQEGDVLPDIAPFAIDDLGRGRALLDVGGAVLWYGHWSDPSQAGEGLFLDTDLIVRAGSMTGEGVPLAELSDGPHAFDLTSAGKYVVFIGTLADGREGAFSLNLGQVKGYCSPKPNSKGCAIYGGFAGLPSASSGAPFYLNANGILSQVQGLLLYGTSGPAASPLQNAVLCVEPPLRRLPPINSGGPLPPGSTCNGVLVADFNAWIASGADPALVPGTTVFTQFWARDPGFPPPGDFSLTQAFEFLIGP
jgi:hypothetical protein